MLWSLNREVLQNSPDPHAFTSLSSLSLHFSQLVSHVGIPVVHNAMQVWKLESSRHTYILTNGHELILLNCVISRP